WLTVATVENRQPLANTLKWEARRRMVNLHGAYVACRRAQTRLVQRTNQFSQRTTEVQALQAQVEALQAWVTIQTL
ncbi:hypothetical protein A2U01_0080270, partial [Trifolium medium]|nr:hypothetical protein [Trifolium medium]